MGFREGEEPKGDKQNLKAECLLNKLSDVGLKCLANIYCRCSIQS